MIKFWLALMAMFAASALDSAKDSSDDGDSTEDGAKPDDDSKAKAGEGDDEPLGEKGLRALVAEREARAKAERELKKAKKDLEAAAAANQTESEKAIAKAREEAKAEVLDKANQRVLRAEVISRAAGKLANPQLAGRLIDLEQFEVDDDGNTDGAKIDKAIESLLKTDPYLAINSRGSKNKTGGDFSGGGSQDDKQDMNTLLRIAAGRD